MLYRLRLTPKAQRSLRALPERLRSGVSDILLDLQEEPEPPDSTAGKPGRELSSKQIIRVNGLRIVYQVDEKDRVVVILTIKLRGSDTYLNL